MKDYHAPLCSGNFYHIFNRGNNSETLFTNEGNYLFFLQKLEKYILPYLRIFAYCLMPNHFHLLARVKEEEEIIENLKNSTKLSKFSRVDDTPPDLDVNRLLEERFQRFFTSYALAYNKQQSRTGSLFQKRFKRIHVHSEQYLIKVLHYVHNNPIHHRFCTEYTAWKYSSYLAMISRQKTNIEREAVIGWFGSEAYFIEFHQQMIHYVEIEEFLFDDHKELY